MNSRFRPGDRRPRIVSILALLLVLPVLAAGCGRAPELPAADSSPLTETLPGDSTWAVQTSETQPSFPSTGAGTTGLSDAVTSPGVNPVTDSTASRTSRTAPSSGTASTVRPPVSSSGTTSGAPTVPPTQPPSVPEKTAQDWLKSMSLEEKVGQMFIARCPAQDAARKAAEYHVGGYILFARDFQGKTPAQASGAIRSYQEAVRIPLFIAVDEEGGTVTRVSKYPAFRSEPFGSPQELFRKGGFSAIREDAEEKCELLRSLGINVNFAPVCDVSVNPEDFIYKRTLGQDAGQTSRFVETVVEVFNKRGMGTVLKHFPGYGNNADTHTGIAYDHRPYETFLTSDFLPFQAGIRAGADMVLVSHNIVGCMDGEYPASLSARVHKILREDLGFSGVIVTDDLAMDGIRNFVGEKEAAVLAVQAGNDLLCSTYFETQIPAVLEAVRRGEISESRIDQSVLRILQMKLDLGIL